jgi:putative oxidoreductase
VSTDDEGIRASRGGAGDPASRPDSLFPELEEISEGPGEPRTRWHVGLDIGLLLLRVVVGGTMAAHGAQKLFGTFDGPGIVGFAEELEGFGYSGPTELLAWVAGLAELAGGSLLVLGLFTPIGAAAVLGVLANAVVVKSAGGFFAPDGLELELVLAGAALTILFTGPGRVGLDANTPWRRSPLPFGFFCLLISAVATALVLVLYR